MHNVKRQGAGGNWSVDSKRKCFASTTDSNRAKINSGLQSISGRPRTMIALFNIFLLFLLSACGEETVKIIEIEKPGTSPPPVVIPPGGGLTGWAKVAPILQSECALSGCHAGVEYLEIEAIFLDSDAPQEIRTNSMPPQYSPRFDLWTPQLRNDVIEYLERAN